MKFPYFFPIYLCNVHGGSPKSNISFGRKINKTRTRNEYSYFFVKICGNATEPRAKVVVSISVDVWFWLDILTLHKLKVNAQEKQAKTFATRILHSLPANKTFAIVPGSNNRDLFSVPINLLNAYRLNCLGSVYATKLIPSRTVTVTQDQVEQVPRSFKIDLGCYKI